MYPPVKRRFADRRDWRRVLARRFSVHDVQSPEFTGVLTLLTIERVTEPLTMPLPSGPLTVAAPGYLWLQTFAPGAHHTVTTMFDAIGRPIQSYIDIIRGWERSPDGIPYWDDLYLDLVVTPQSSPILLDEPELEAAERAGIIGPEERIRAWQEVETVRGLLREGRLPVLESAARLRDAVI